MIAPNSNLHGIIRGKTIELDRAPGIPDGQPVSVDVRVASQGQEGLKRAFGAWSDDASELDAFLDEIRISRKAQRDEVG
jgi:hypothetical protein